MSTASANPAQDPTVSAVGSPNIIGPRLQIPQMGVKPEHKRPWWFIGAILFGQLGIFLALMGPATVSIGLKVTELTSDAAEQASMLGWIMPWGAIAAVVFNAVGGRMSDRTTWRLGRRRPWLIIGAVGMTGAMVILAFGTSTFVLALGWFLAQAFGNIAFSAFLASISDQLPEIQYGRTSGFVGVAQNVAIMVATWFAAWFSENMLLLFMVPAILGAVCIIGYALTLPEPVLERNRYPFNLVELLTTFWRNPITFPDFGLAWWSRFMIILASYLFITFRVLYMVNHLGLSSKEAASAVAVGVTIYTLVSMVSGVIAGWISDVTGRRKVLVAISILIFALGIYMLLHADTVGFFYFCEAIMGFAWGMYIAVDLALVLQVLPDPLNNGKDLGVFNMANALPQSLAPAFGAFLLKTLGDGTDFGPLLITAAICGVIGAVLTMFIRSVR